MTDKEKLDKLVAEIKRRYKECKGATPATEYQELFDFIASMQKEPVSENLAEAAIQYAKSKHTGKALQEIVAWDFEAGANWQKEQMMKDVVDGTFSTGELADGTPIDAIFNFDKLVRSKYEEGEKVKLIVIKK